MRWVFTSQLQIIMGTLSNHCKVRNLHLPLPRSYFTLALQYSASRPVSLEGAPDQRKCEQIRSLLIRENLHHAYSFKTNIHNGWASSPYATDCRSSSEQYC